jgi:hypothetical protein
MHAARHSCVLLSMKQRTDIHEHPPERLMARLGVSEYLGI